MREQRFTIRDGDPVPPDVKCEGKKCCISTHTLYCRSRASYGGMYYEWWGDGPHVIARTSKAGYPCKLRLYQRGQHRDQEYFLANRAEALVYVMAHELRHHWQFYGKEKASSFPTGYAPNSRGVASEIDTEAYAIHMLRKWRAR
jgi:hypothetical protein